MCNTSKRGRSRWLIGLGLLVMASHAWALNIMLVNDDGCNAPGINSLADALENAGYTVTMYAPAANQSGQGSRIALPSRGYAVTFTSSNMDLSGQPTTDSSRHCVSATVIRKNPNDNSGIGVPKLPPPYTKGGQTLSASPADSVRVGLKSLDAKPDLVISGINHGNNVSVTAFSSGTVSAALQAITEGVPAIAVSLALHGDYHHAAAFVVSLVEELQAENSASQLLPDGIGLNVNIPRGNPKGVVLTRFGQIMPITPTLVAVAGHDNRLEVRYVFHRGSAADPTVPKDEIKLDSTAVREGYISITPIEADLSASHTVMERIHSRLGTFTP